MHNNYKFNRYFFPHILTVLVSVCLSGTLIASPTQEPIDDACVSDELNEAKQNQNETNKQTYEKYCAGCHSSDGSGVPEVFPPLLDSEWTSNSQILANIILRGVSGTIYVNEVRYASSMPSFAKELTDEEVIAIVKYVQEELNKHKSSITTADVTTIREKELGRISNQQGLEKLQKQYTATPK
jgi:mono/diheme cytochrome c family protein